MEKVVLSLSGGLDSTSLLAEILSQGYEVIPVIFTYGSKHNRYENLAANKVCEFYKLQPVCIDLSAAMAGFKSNLLKSGGDIPEGHYNDASMSKTVVPGRNLIFISILAGLAESIGAVAIALAVHAGDHHIYPDCRPEFIEAARRVLHFSTEGKVELFAPFLHIDKKEVLSYGLSHLAPLEMTRTCYKDQPTACGKCGSCTERLEAFKLCGKEDPIIYET